MQCISFVVLCLVPCVVLSTELSIIWDSKLDSYGLRKGKVGGYISLLNFKNDINKTGYVRVKVHRVKHLLVPRPYFGRNTAAIG